MKRVLFVVGSIVAVVWISASLHSTSTPQPAPAPLHTEVARTPTQPHPAPVKPRTTSRPQTEDVGSSGDGDDLGAGTDDNQSDAQSDDSGSQPADDGQGLSTFATEDDAQTHCADDTVVWLNLSSGIYHYRGERWYGTTENGAYVCEQEAIAAGDRATENGQ